jgi:hypothetical protein
MLDEHHHQKQGYSEVFMLSAKIKANIVERKQNTRSKIENRGRENTFDSPRDYPAIPMKFK